MLAKNVTLLCARSQETVILATVSELSRLELRYLAVNTLASILTMKHVWEAEDGQREVLHPWSMEQRCTLLSLSTALVAVSCHCYLSLLLACITDIVTTYTVK